MHSYSYLCQFQYLWLGNSVDEIRLSAILNSSKLETPPAFACDIVKTLRSERQAVERYIAKSESGQPRRVYGFTTYLGQRDNVRHGDGYQLRLLKEHLVGRTFTLPTQVFRLISLVKLAQLSQGGSGVSESTFESLCSRLQDFEDNPIGAWNATYGTGDVVPASWWISNLFSEEEVENFANGDLIALMNGNFFSTGYSISVFCKFLRACAEFIDVFRNHSYPPISQGTPNLVTKQFSSPRSALKRTSFNIQPRVSTRDNTPFANAIDHSIRLFSESLGARINTRSCNPLFEFHNGEVLNHHSQSSFLDIRLSSVLELCSDCVRFLGAALQSLIRATGENSGNQIERPKIAEVLIDQMAQQSSSRFSINEAAGIEDVCDRTLARAVHLEQSIQVLVELTELTRVQLHEERPQAEADEIESALYSAAGL